MNVSIFLHKYNPVLAVIIMYSKFNIMVTVFTFWISDEHLKNINLCTDTM